MNDFLKNKKNLITVLILLILITGIPLGLQLIKKEQTLKSKAVEPPRGVTFSGPNVATRNNRTILKLDADGNARVDLVITAPNVPGTQPTSTPSPSGSPAPTSAVSPSPTGTGPSVTPSPTTVNPSPTPSPSPTPRP
ncbi:MAG: putative peptidoglycan binding protein [Microgenomates group bacterium Gr01-1014_7]|nr:MAG: putative peptidoglycan binding protein [Microgenomates group bacterium Gr01-1014_7]